MRSIRGMSTLAIASLTLALILVALPVSATPPDDIRTEAELVFDVSSGTVHGEGAWSSEGLITSSGQAEEGHFVAGWPPAHVFKTAHLTETWRDANGEITIQTQLNVGEWTIVSFPSDVHYEGSGHWVVKSGTGAYENLKGKGAVTFVGDITPDSYPNLIVAESYEGVAHFEP